MDLTNRKFGRLTVVAQHSEDTQGRTKWLCMCECGNTCVVRFENLTRGHTRSCGCLKKDALLKHGDYKSRLYHLWAGMKNRCFNSRDPHYPNYGGRGVTIWDEWVTNYISFREWALSSGYSDHLTIERKDVNGNYSPENCTWIPKGEQVLNRRNTIYIEHNGVVRSLIDWAKELGIGYKTAYSRYKRNNLFLEEENV